MFLKSGFLLVLFFSVNATASGLYYDMGDDWVQEIESGQEAIEADNVAYGNGLCFAGNPAEIANTYFSVGDSFTSENQGRIEVTSVGVQNHTIQVSFLSSQDGEGSLHIEECSKDLDIDI